MRGLRLRSIVTSCVLATSLVAAPSAVGAAYADDGGVGTRIIGGETVSSASWATQLYWGDHFGCSASLIAPRWVLTARHCVDSSPTHVLVGNIQLGQGTRATVNRVVRSPDGDAALLRLATSVNRTPVRLANANPPVGATSQIYGWGTFEVGEGHPVSDVLKRAGVRMERVAGDAYDGPALQGVWVTGTAGYGDSGGPQIYNGTQVGICSTGDYTRVWYASVATHRAWIRSISGV